MAGRIHRVTMFKLPVPEDQEKLIEAYKTLAKDQQKVSLDFSRLLQSLSSVPIRSHKPASYITLPLPVRTL